MNIWNNFTVEEKQCHLHQVGPLKIWIEFKNKEWLIASERVPNDKEVLHSEVLSETPDNANWCRFVIPGKEKSAVLHPVTPDRSVVVKPESTLKIASGASALYFVLIPLWINISVGVKNKHSVVDLPSQILSNTWFGEPHHGELCYSLKTAAKRSLEGVNPRPHQAVCPVYIKNNSLNELDFNRLCIRTEFLSIYKGSSWLWTNKVNVHFRGENQSSKIKYDMGIPTYEPSCQLLSSPRQRPLKEFSLKSFDTFIKFASGL